MKIHHFFAPDDSRDQRLDQLIAGQFPDFSRTLARKLIDLGGVHVEGRRTRKCAFRAPPGAEIRIYIDGYSLEPFVLSEEDLLFKDPYLIALDKPAGVDTQPTHARYRGTVYDAVRRFLQDPLRPDLSPELGMVQRLDRGTSGVMVFSTHCRAHAPLTEAFSSRGVRKLYLALVQGEPLRGGGEIRTHLVRSRNGNRMMSVTRGGKEALTRFRVLASSAKVSLIALEILTGRTHQIRVHMAEEGVPLLGDTFYGGPKEMDSVPLERCMLHALRLEFAHPQSGAPLGLCAPIPRDMKTLCQQFLPQFDLESLGKGEPLMEEGFFNEFSPD